MKITETIILEGSTVRCTIPQYAHVEDPEAPGGYDIHTADRQAELSYLEFIEQIITPVFDDLNRFGIPDEDTVEVITQRVLRQVDSRLATTATLHLDETLEILLTKDDGYHVELIKYAGKGVLRNAFRAATPISREMCFSRDFYVFSLGQSFPL